MIAARDLPIGRSRCEVVVDTKLLDAQEGMHWRCDYPNDFGGLTS